MKPPWKKPGNQPFPTNQPILAFFFNSTPEKKIVQLNNCMESCSTSWSMLPLIGQFYWWRLLIGPTTPCPHPFTEDIGTPQSGQVYKGTFLYKIATFRQPFCFTHLNRAGTYVIKHSLKNVTGHYADNMVWTATHHWRGKNFGIKKYKSTNAVGILQNLGSYIFSPLWVEALTARREILVEHPPTYLCRVYIVDPVAGSSLPDKEHI